MSYYYRENDRGSVRSRTERRELWDDNSRQDGFSVLQKDAMKAAGVWVLSLSLSMAVGELPAAQRSSAQAPHKTPGRGAFFDNQKPKPAPKPAPPASSHYAFQTGQTWKL